MGWFKTIQAKIAGFLYPISIFDLLSEGWVKVSDSGGPFGEFLSYKKWQCDNNGKIGHRFILYPKNNNWHNPQEWTLIDFSKDVTYPIYSSKQIYTIIPTPYI